MWIVLVAAIAVGGVLINALNKEVKSLRSLVNRQGAELREAIDQLEGLKQGDRAALDAVHDVMFREQLRKVVKETGAENLLS